MNTIIGSPIIIKDVLIIGIICTLILLFGSLVVRNFVLRYKARLVYQLLLISGGLCLTMGFLLMLESEEYKAACTVLLFLVLLPLPLALWNGFKTKNPVQFLDAAALVLLLPCLQFDLYTMIYYFASVLYFLARASFTFSSALANIHTHLNRYVIKESLDNLDIGIAIVNKKGNFAYINKAFSSYLEKKSVDPLQKAQIVFGRILEGAEQVDPSSWLLTEKEKSYFLKRKNSFSGEDEILLIDVSSEIALQKELSETNRQLREGQAELLVALDNLKEIEKIKEKERMRMLVHDSFAAEVSYLHQVIINPEITDLKGLKELADKDIFDAREESHDLSSLIKPYELLNIEFRISGSLEGLPHQREAFQMIREGIDNAIRHGKASEISIDIEKGQNEYSVSLINNGSLPRFFAMHNGLTNLKNLLSQVGGSLETRAGKEFVLKAVLPLK